MKPAKPVNVCIYCGERAGKLKGEHVIPYGLDGTLKLKKASCQRCKGVTHAFEGHLLGGECSETSVYLMALVEIGT